MFTQNWLIAKLMFTQNWLSAHLMFIQNWLRAQLMFIQNSFHAQLMFTQNWLHAHLMFTQNSLRAQLMFSQIWLSAQLMFTQTTPALNRCIFNSFARNWCTPIHVHWKKAFKNFFSKRGNSASVAVVYTRIKTNLSAKESYLRTCLIHSLWCIRVRNMQVSNSHDLCRYVF